MAKRDYAVFTVQLHRKRAFAALTMPFTTVFRLRAFVHHDVGVTRFRSSHRHHRNVFITFNGDGQRRFRRIAVRIRDGVGEGFRNGRVLRHVHAGVQLIGIGAVRVQRQLTIITFQRSADRTFRIAVLDGGYRLFGGAVCTEFIVVQYVAACCSRLCHGLRKRNIVCASRRHVVHDVHSDGAVDRSPIRIRYRHGKVVRNLVHAGTVMFCGIVLQGIIELQLARNRIEARHLQNTFIRGNSVTGTPSVFKHHNAADDDGVHAVGGRDDQGAAGRDGSIELTGLRAVHKTGLIHRHFIRTRRRISRLDNNTVVLAVDGDGYGTLGYIAVRVRIGVGELFRQRLAIRERLHRRVVVVEPVAVGTVGIQGNGAVLPVLARVPGEVSTVRTGFRTLEGIAHNGHGIPFRHFMRKAFDGRFIVHNVHGDGAASLGAVCIRHGHGKVMGNLCIRGVGIVLRGVVAQHILELQLARARIEARHRQRAFIRGNSVTGKHAVFKHHNAADDDGDHAVGSTDAQ